MAQNILKTASPTSAESVPSPARTREASPPLLVLLLITCLTLPACGAETPPTASTASGQAQAQAAKAAYQPVTLDGEDFRLELALTPDTRFRGLSDRESIDPDGGMLFVFPKARRLSFVMRRCLVPIDIIFLEPSGRVLRTYAMAVEPYDTPEHKLRQYDSRYPAQFAIELKGGTLDKLDIKPGDTVDLPLNGLKRRAE